MQLILNSPVGTDKTKMFFSTSSETGNVIAGFCLRFLVTLCVNIVWDNPSLQFSVECEGEEEKNNDTGTEETHHESKWSNGQ